MRHSIRLDLILVLAGAILHESKAWALVHPALTPRGWPGAPQLGWCRPTVGTAKAAPPHRSPALLAGADPQMEASLELVGRVLTRADLGRACEIDAACYGGAGLWSKESYAADISAHSADVVGLFSSTTLVGFGCLSVVLDEGSVTNVAVSPRPVSTQGVPQHLPGSYWVGCLVAALDATQGQNGSSFSHLPYKCYLEEVASVGD